jgi:pSer/pThr/pTyr-binding forkhead associated (FHA) protein
MARPAPKVSGVHLVGPETTVKLGLGTFTVGRVAGADVRVDDKQVSRSHATITVGDGSVSIEDLQTVNGTLVNGREIKVRTVLQNGDTVLFGATEFKVEIVVS